MEPKFVTSRNRLTRYSFACGYKEIRSTDDGLETEMYMEHGVLHVRQFDRRPGHKYGRVFWHSFNRLTEARRLFDRQDGTLVR